MKKCDDMCIHLDIVLALNRQTDRQTQLLKQYHALHALHAYSGWLAFAVSPSRLSLTRNIQMHSVSGVLLAASCTYSPGLSCINAFEQIYGHSL